MPTKTRRLVDLAARHRLPTMYVFKEAVEGGGLMSYRTDIPGLAGLAGKYVVKILKGARPSDLPVEQPVKFDLAINPVILYFSRNSNIILSSPL